MAAEPEQRQWDALKDADLARAAASGDDQAFEALARRHYKAVLNAAWRYTGNREDAWDAAQETFVSIRRAIAQFQDTGHLGSFRAWLLRIAANKALDLTRRRKRRGEVPLEESVDPGGLPAKDAPDRGASLGELGSIIQRCMDRLSPEHRITLMLREIDGMNYAEIAEATGVPVGTVMSRLFVARRKMRDMLRQAGVWPGQEKAEDSEG